MSLWLLFGFRLSAHAQDITISSPRNCDANAVIWCGVGSTEDLISKYNSGDSHNSAKSIQDIYSYYGITSSDINNLSSSSEVVESGRVDIDGKVYGDKGKLLATDALTGGRQDIAGSTKEDENGTIFYARPPKVSFLDRSLPAIVVLKNNQFAYAILAACGNAVEATPVPPVKTHTPPPQTQTTQPQVTTPTSVQPSSPSVAPQAQCTSLSVNYNQSNPLTINVTANYVTTDNAQLSSATFNYGNGYTSPASTQTSQNYTYPATGDYLITATLNFTGSQAIPTSTCQASVAINTSRPTPTSTIVSTSSTTPTTTATPTTSLVNTGPGDVIAAFGISSTLSALAYRLYLSRRLAKI
jgi:hypothetical protein